MRRAPIVITSTVLGTAAVLAFKPHQPVLATTSPPAAASPSPTATGTASAGGSSSTRSGSSSSSSSSSALDAVATGAVIPTQYGNAQVRVTIANGRITDVQALQLQGNDPKSVQISGSAAPLLRASALTKQTAAIDAVSGATVTSASYEASLQSALDKAGFKAADGSRGSSEVPQVEEHDDHGGGPPQGFPG